MYTYAFLPNPDRPLNLPSGIAGAVQLVPAKGLAALVEPELDFAALQANDQHLMRAILAHDRTVRRLFQQTNLLPLRFGTSFVSRQGLLDHLEARQEEYAAKLAKLKGKAEYLLKLTALPNQSLTSQSLPQVPQISQGDSAQAELQQLIEAIDQRYPDWVRGEPNSGIERFYILGDRIQERLLYEYLAIWQTQFVHWSLSLGEMLPPYHFV